jgi:hypothetical protein
MNASTLQNVIFGVYSVPGTGYSGNAFQFNVFENIFLDFQNNFRWNLYAGDFYNGDVYTYGRFYVSPLENNLHGFLDMTNPAIYNAGTKTLTVPTGYSGCGELWLLNSAGEEITTVSGLNQANSSYRNGIKFRIWTGTGATFKVTTPLPGVPPSTLVGEADGVLHGQAYPTEYVMVALNPSPVAPGYTNLYIKDKLIFT